ncbi:hypothetical protein [Legionella hackeliae]|nr:hypothetical protein [Legionella hackeliae]
MLQLIIVLKFDGPQISFYSMTPYGWRDSVTGKKEYFSEQFNRWRLGEAKKEEAVLLTVLEISSYFETGIEIEQIKKDFCDTTSSRYKELDCFKKRELGALVYCKFVAQDYLQSVDQEEKELLESIIKNIEGLYLQNRTDTQKKLNSLTQNCNIWLDNYTKDKEDPAQIKALCSSLYLLLKILEIFLQSLSSWSKKLAGSFVDIDALIKEIGCLLIKTEVKFNQIKLLNSAKNLSPVPKNLAELFDKSYLQLLETNPVNTPDALLGKVFSLENMVSHTNRLGAVLKKRMEIKSRLQNAQSLLIALENNAHRALGRKYFLEFIEKHDKHFNELMEHLDSEVREMFLERIEQLKNPNGSQKIISSVQYGASWATALPTSALRLALPQNWQDTVSSVVPATWDSQCKDQLKGIIVGVSKDLKQDLTEVEKEVTSFNDKFAVDKTSYEQFVKEISAEVIETVSVSSNALLQSIQRYKNLLTFVFDTQEKLKEIKSLDNKVSEFLYLYDGFWVKISNFFARFCAFFKTEAAQLVDKAREIQNELRSLEKKHHDVFERVYEEYIKEQGTLHPQLQACFTKNAKAIINTIEIDTKETLANKTIHQSSVVINKGFFSVKKKSTALDNIQWNELKTESFMVH